MRRVFVIVFCAVIICCAIAVSAAPTTDWRVCLSACYTGGLQSSTFTCGTGTSPYTVIGDPPSSTPVLGEEFDSFHLITTDIRSPLSPGESTSWYPILACGDGMVLPIKLTISRMTPVQYLDISFWMDGVFYYQLEAYETISFELFFDPISPSDSHQFEIRATAVPEPGSLCCILAGLVGFATHKCRRRK